MRGRTFRIAALALGLTFALTTTGAVLANRTNVAQQHLRATLLEEAGITLGPGDRVSADLDQRPSDGMTVRVVRVAERVISVKSPIPFKIERKVTTDLRPGISVVERPGKEGVAFRTYKVTFEDGKETGRVLIKEQVLATPQNRLVKVGYSGTTSRGLLGSRLRLNARRVLRMHATAYDPGPRSCGRSADGCTALGLRAGKGVVAVDPRVIRLGSRLYIEGYGHAIAGDTGRAIKGHRIDLGFNTYREARRFGRRHVTVHVLK